VKVQQSFSIDQPRDRVWEFLLNIPDVARCVPGVEEVEVIDDEHSRVRLTQAVGPMSATFDLNMRITERVEHERVQFTASGKAVKGAAGTVRTINTVSLDDDGDGTRVGLDADMAMGGVLGSIGQKVIAKQATGVTSEFAAALERALNGKTRTDAASTSEDAAEVPSPTPPPGRARPSRSRVAAPSGGPSGPAGSREPWHQDPRVTGLVGLSAGLVVALAVALRRR
jgi:carbon monoxide dehydrogenase subunit G